MKNNKCILRIVVASLILFLQTSLSQAQVNINMGSVTSTTSPSGNFYDPGGPSGSYFNSQYFTLLIQPAGATSVTLTINSYSGESCCDYLTVYDGTSTSGTMLVQIVGSLPSIPTVVTANSGSMFITWSSDVSAVGAGWVSSWTSNTLPPPTLGPLPTITSFSPTVGNIGITDTIIGTNFSTTPADNVVYFGASRAPVLSATATQLLVSVPTGITHKPISVTRNGLTAFTSKPYSTTYNNSSAIGGNSFSSNGSISAFTTVQATYIADLNNDGKPEFIEASSSTIAIRRNISQQGTLSPTSFDNPVYLTGNSGITDVKVADIDGDGRLDIITANSSNSTISIIRNLIPANGSNFTSADFSSRAQYYVSGGYNYRVDLADMDNDGKVDIVTPNYYSNTVSVIKNNSYPGVTSFGSPTNYTTGTYPWDLGLADMDNDGKIDIVVGNSGSNTISIIKNTTASGNLSFNTKVDYTASTSPFNIELKDIDNDNKIDVSYISQSATNVFIRRNNSIQGVIDATSLNNVVTIAANNSSVLADFEYVEINGDGKLDLVACYSSGQNYSLWQNNSISGTISAASFGTRIDFTNSSVGQFLTTYDVDGDRRNDLLFSNNNNISLNLFKNQNSIFAVNSISPSLYATGASIQIPFTFTMQANPGNFFTAQLSDSSGSFANPVNLGTIISSTSGVITGSIPVNTIPGNNYKLRVISTSPTLISEESINSIRILVPPQITSITPAIANVGQTLTINGSNFSVIASENVVQFGSVRGTVISATSTQLNVVLPAGAINAPVSVTVLTHTAISAQVLKVSYNGIGSITASTFGTPSSFSTGGATTNPMNIEMYDVDQDRKPDIIIPNNGPSAPTTNAVFRNQSTGVINGSAFAPIVNFGAASTAWSTQMVDIDGDGIKDMVTINNGAATLSVQRNAQLTNAININSFEARADLATASNPNGLGYGDLDRDGKIDLVTANFSSNNVSIFKNISNIGTITSASFATRLDVSTGLNTGPVSVLLHDVNADGWVDMIVANSLNNTIAIYRNTSSVGSINFAAPVSYASNSSPRSMVVDDINDDNKPELLVTNQGSSNFSIFQNNSTATTINFLSKVDFTTGNGPWGIATGDINGDGKVDVAVCNLSSNTVSIYGNIHSSGIISASSFAAPVAVSTSSQPNGVAICDINDDLRPELIVSTYGNGFVNIYPNNTSFFSTNQISGQICAGSTIGVGFTTTTSFSLGNIFTAQLSDANGSFNNPTTIGSIIGTTSGTINATIPSNTVIGTNYRIRVISTNPSLISNDSRSNLSVVNCPQITSITPLSGPLETTITITGSNFSTTPSQNVINVGGIIVPARTATSSSVTATIPAGTSYKPISLTVLSNGITASSKESFNPTYMGSNASFGFNTYNPGVTFSTNYYPRHVISGDLDGDGEQDLVVSSEGTSSVQIYRNAHSTGQTFGSSSLILAQSYTLPNISSQSVLGDIDGDGKLDLVVFVWSSNQICIFRNTSTNGNISFASRVDIISSVAIRYGTLADVDNDGKSDIIATHSGFNYISVYKNNTLSGSINANDFANRTSVNSPTNLVFIKPCDLDNDGRVDFVAGNSSSSTFTIMRNTTGVISSTMFSSFNISTGSTVSSFVNVADMDNDGKQDIIVTCNSLSRLSVYRNLYTSGNMTASSFASPVNITTSTAAFSTSITDINGDNKLDIVSGNTSASGFVSIIKNNSTSGSLSFDLSYSYTGFYDIGAVETADLNMDGKQDIIAVNSGYNNFSVLINNVETFSTGNVSGGPYCGGAAISVPFSAPSGQFMLGNMFTAQMSDSSGSFANPSIIGSTIGTNSGTINGNVPQGLVPGSNYRIRIISTSPAYTSTISNSIALLSCPTITNFTPIAAAPNTIVTINGFNFSSSLTGNTVWFGSAKATVLTASSTTLTVRVPHGAIVSPITLTYGGYTTTSQQQFVPTFAGNPGISATSFAARIDVVSGVTGSRSIEIADFDEDGKVDLSAIAASADRLNQYRNTSTSTTFTSANFLGTTNNTTGAQPWQHVIADFDNDGKLDLAVTNANSNTLSVFKNTSSLNNISNSLKVDFTTGSLPYGIAAGDIDGDGYTDLIVTNLSSNTISLFKNTSTGNTINFATKVDFTTLVQPIAAVVTELDGDGKADIMVSCFGSNQLSIFRNVSSTGIINTNSLAARSDISSGISPFSISSADIDGDGKIDIVVPNYSGSNISVFRNTSTSGTILFANPLIYATQSAPSSVGFGDVDGDGRADILVTNQSSNSISVFQNNSISGAVILATPINIVHTGGPISLALGDMNNDSRPDLIIANNTGNSISVLLNNTVAPSPTNASTNLVLSAITANSITLNWNNGNGSRRIIVARASSATNTQPVDGAEYTASSVFGLGTMIGTNNFIVYNGNGNSVTVTGLNANTNYIFTVYEYNGTGGATNYLTTPNLSNNGTTVPVQLVSFCAKYFEGDAILNWITASELNNKGFIVERSFDNKTWTPIDFVKGKGTSNQTNNYKYVDVDLAQHGVSEIYYRLVQQDYDGKEETLPTRVVNLNGIDAPVNISVMPNPAQSNITITTGLHTETLSSFIITNMIGNTVLEGALNQSDIAQLDISTLAAGTYHLKITTNSGVKVIKIVKQ